jgi:predicted nucleic acid-binding protein
MAVVSNTSPLRYFIQIDRANVVNEVLGEILIPRAVFRELTHPSSMPVVRQWMMERPDWLSIRDLDLPPAAELSELLDQGESEAIQLALDLRAELLLIDEKNGRAEATRRGLRIVGALGILREAYRLRLAPQSNRLIASGSFGTTTGRFPNVGAIATSPGPVNCPV